MESLDLSWIISVIDGRTDGSPSKSINGITTDSRSVKPGDLFFALRGEVHDGHVFARSAVEKGATASVVSHSSGISGPGIILVDDPLKALQTLSGRYRGRFNIPIIAITGSHGKTTTKDIAASIFSTQFRVLKTHENLNGIIGVPLMLLQLDRTTEIAVIEVGVSIPGEMDLLAQLVRPDSAIFTCAALSHTEYMRDVETIVAEKSRLFDRIPDHGLALINADDPRVSQLKLPARTIRYGLKPADYQGRIITASGNGVELEVRVRDGESHRFTIPLPGRHNASNCLAAIAMAFEYGLSADNIQNGLASLHLSPHRSNVIKVSTLTILDDSYNAAPASMSASLQMLAEYPVSGKRLAVLGDMLELGVISEEAHRNLGKSLDSFKIDKIFLYGSLMKFAYEEALSRATEVLYFSDSDSLFECLIHQITEGDAVLFKASHSMRADLIVSRLIGNLAVCQDPHQ